MQSEEELTIVARMRDFVSNKLKGIGKEARQTREKVDRNFKQMGRSASSLGSEFQKMRMVAAAAFLAIGTATTAGSISMSRSAADAEELSSKFDALFGNAADAARDWAETYRASVNRGRQDTLAALADMRGFTEGLGLAADEADALAFELTKLGVDLSSFYNVDQQDALLRLRSGLIGNAEALDVFAARISENQLKEFAAEQGLVTSELSDTEKVLLRLELLQVKVNKAIGDAERTAGSFQNTMRDLGGQLTDTSAEMGVFVNEGVLRAVDSIGGRGGFNDVLRVGMGTLSELGVTAVHVGGLMGGEFVRQINAAGGAEAVLLSLRIRFAELRLTITETLGPMRSFQKWLASWNPGAMIFDNAADALFGPSSTLQAYQERVDAIKAIQDELTYHVERQRGFMSGRLEGGNEQNPLTGTTRFQDASNAVSEYTRQLGLAQMELEQFVEGSGEEVQQLIALHEELQSLRFMQAREAGTPEAPEFTLPTPTALPTIETEKVKEATIAVHDYSKEVARAQERTKTAFAGQFSSFFGTIASGAQTASEAVRSLVANLAGLTAQGLAQQAIFPAFGLSSPTLFANGGVAAGGFSNAMPIHGYADGGPVFRRPHLAVIGEGRYNEAAVPLPDGRRIPVDMRGMDGGGGGESTTVQLTVNAVDARSVAELFAQNGEALANVIARQFGRDRVFKSALTGGA